MSEATIFEFPYNLFVKQRLEFVVICQDHLAAAIMRIVEYEMIKSKETWQNKVVTAVEAKKTPPKEPAEYWVRLSHGQLIAKLYYYDSGKIEKPGEDATEEEIREYLKKKGIALSKSTIRRTINLLIEMGFLLMRSKPGDEFGAPLYTLHRANIQKAMKALPQNPFSIFNYWGGVSNLESGGELANLEVPLNNLESGELPNCEVGVAKNESPHFPNCEVFKDNRDITSKISEDNLKEGTSASSVDDDATPSPSFANGEDDGTNNTNTASLQSDHHSSVNGVTVRVDIRHSEEVNGQSTSTENAENNRLTSTPESPSQQNVSTDESPLRIERETANETPSSPVIEPTNDEMIHTDARKDGDSYSPKSVPVAGTPEEKTVQKRVEKSKSETPSVPPKMPADDVPWTAETLIQVLEAHKGRRYPNGAKRKSDRVRDVELESAEVLIADAADLWTEDTAVNRELLLKIVTRIETKDNNWWLDRLGPVLPHQLVDKDRIHTVYDELVRMRQIKTFKEQRDKVQQQVTVEVGSMSVNVHKPKETDLERKNREMREKYGKRQGA